MKDTAKWEAVTKNDQSYDGVFYYALKTTGVFCRPSCKSKLPRKENVIFFTDSAQAQAAGFRACKRCRPDLLVYQPLKELAAKVKQLADNFFLQKDTLREELQNIGLTQHRLAAIFKEEYSVSLVEYIRLLRIKEAKSKLAADSSTVLEIAYSSGFESMSSFYRFFKKQTGTSPAKYRDKYKKGVIQP